MQIEYKKNIVPFSDIKIGCFFKHEESVYLKTCQGHAFNLVTEFQYGFADSEGVCPIKGKIIIYDTEE